MPMQGASIRLPAESESDMPQYTIKLHTYDPDIVKTFEQLRRNRKQAVFTHEALKHFIASGKGAQVIELMSNDPSLPVRTDPTVSKVGLSHEKALLTQACSHQPCSDSSTVNCSGVLEKILR